MTGEQFEEELYRENLYFVYEDKCKELEQEIERLTKENKILRENAEHNDKVVDKVNWENERLNNIINELDNMFYETFRISQNGYYSISEWELKGFTDKLQELKGEKE